MRTSWHALRRWGAVALACSLVSALLGACESSDVSVIADDRGAYGRPELLDAIQRFSQSDRSATRFRELASAIEVLDPRFDKVVRKEAERHLVFLALVPLEASHTDPDARLEDLATTVWPTAFRVPPQADETAAHYAERLCASTLAVECKHVVPEYRAVVLDAVAWEYLRERAHDAVAECDSCTGVVAYQTALETYDRYYRHAEAAVLDISELAAPGRWPRAGAHASPWSDALLLEIRKKGPHVLDGRPLASGELAEALRRGREGHQRLGIFIRASAPVSELRAALDEVRAAGFFDVALQVRAHTYPYALGQYSLTTDPRHATIPVRDIDTVQVLVQALDVAAETSDRAPRI